MAILAIRYNENSDNFTLLRDGKPLAQSSSDLDLAQVALTRAGQRDTVELTQYQIDALQFMDLLPA